MNTFWTVAAWAGEVWGAAVLAGVLLLAVGAVYGRVWDWRHPKPEPPVEWCDNAPWCDCTRHLAERTALARAELRLEALAQADFQLWTLENGWTKEDQP